MQERTSPSVSSLKRNNVERSDVCQLWGWGVIQESGAHENEGTAS